MGTRESGGVAPPLLLAAVAIFYLRPAGPLPALVARASFPAKAGSSGSGRRWGGLCWHGDSQLCTAQACGYPGNNLKCS